MNKLDPQGIPHTTPRQSATFTHDINSDIRRAAATGIYDIRGGGGEAKSSHHLMTYYFLGASISRYPLEGYREKCETTVTNRWTKCREPNRIRHPHYNRRHVIWSSVRASERGIGPRAHLPLELQQLLAMAA